MKILTIIFATFINVGYLFSQNCETPIPTSWHNFHENDSVGRFKPDSYRIQFLSVKHDKPINIPFKDYVEEKQGCFRRFYISHNFENLEAALLYLPFVRQHYPDAFPIKSINRQQ